MGMTGQLVPIGPAVQDMATLLKSMESLEGITRLYMQSVARFPYSEPSGNEPRHFHCLLNIKTVIQHCQIALQLNLRLAVSAHAAQNTPKIVITKRDRSDQGM